MYNIVFPTNFTKQSRRVIVEFIKNFTPTLNVQVNYTILHAYQMAHVGQNVMLDFEESLLKNAEEDMRKFTAEIQSKLEKKVSLNSFIKNGTFESSLLKFDNENEINLVVLVETKNSPFKEILSEKKLSELSSSITEPILYIPSKPEYVIPKKIAFATDLKPFENMHDFKNFLGFTKNSGATLEFIHVSNEEKDFQPEFNAIFKDILEQYNIEPVLKIVKGKNVNAAIKNFIETDKPQIIALVEREGSFFNRWFEKQTVDVLSNYDKLPVFVISENIDDTK